MEHPCQYSYGLVCPLLQPTNQKKYLFHIPIQKGKSLGQTSPQAVRGIMKIFIWHQQNQIQQYFNFVFLQ